MSANGLRARRQRLREPVARSRKYSQARTTPHRESLLRGVFSLFYCTASTDNTFLLGEYWIHGPPVRVNGISG